MFTMFILLVGFLTVTIADLFCVLPALSKIVDQIILSRIFSYETVILQTTLWFFERSIYH